jgi:hypothetical protein
VCLQHSTTKHPYVKSKAPRGNVHPSGAHPQYVNVYSSFEPLLADASNLAIDHFIERLRKQTQDHGDADIVRIAEFPWAIERADYESMIGRADISLLHDVLLRVNMEVTSTEDGERVRWVTHGRVADAEAAEILASGTGSCFGLKINSLDHVVKRFECSETHMVLIQRIPGQVGHHPEITIHEIASVMPASFSYKISTSEPVTDRGHWKDWIALYDAVTGDLYDVESLANTDGIWADTTVSVEVFSIDSDFAVEITYINLPSNDNGYRVGVQENKLISYFEVLNAATWSEPFTVRSGSPGNCVLDMGAASAFVWGQLTTFSATCDSAFSYCKVYFALDESDVTMPSVSISAPWGQIDVVEHIIVHSSGMAVNDANEVRVHGRCYNDAGISDPFDDHTLLWQPCAGRGQLIQTVEGPLECACDSYRYSGPACEACTQGFSGAQCNDTVPCSSGDVCAFTTCNDVPNCSTCTHSLLSAACGLACTGIPYTLKDEAGTCLCVY